MSRKLKWGLIGTGNIAAQFAGALQESHHGELVAIGSRSQAGADAFAARFPATAHGSYEALLADPAVEVLYLSTPHPWHEQWAVQAARAGKAILCEKPLTVNSAQAERVIAAARDNDVFLMEAFMYRAHPQTLRLIRLLESQPIGEIRFIRASFSIDLPYSPENWIFDHARAGGSILALGCYAVSMARLVAGVASGQPFADPVEVKGVAHLGRESRVDESALASLRFENGIVAEIASGSRLALENNVRIVGTEGSILVPSPWMAAPANGFSKILLFKEGVPEEIVVEAQRGIYAFEADHVAEAIVEGHRESPLLSWADTLGNMRTLDAWRASAGLAYDHE